MPFRFVQANKKKSVIYTLNVIPVPRGKEGYVYTCCPNISAWTPARNGAVFRHWVPKITSYTDAHFSAQELAWVLKKGCVHIIDYYSAAYLSTLLGHQCMALQIAPVKLKIFRNISFIWSLSRKIRILN